MDPQTLYYYGVLAKIKSDRPGNRDVLKDPVRTFPLAAGLLEHKRRMGSTIWEYLWLMNHVTSDEPDGSGKFLGIVRYGNPISAEAIARDLKESIDTAKTNLRRLEATGYVIRKRAVGAGYAYKVINSKKWIWKRNNSRQAESSLAEKMLDDHGDSISWVQNPSMENSPDLSRKPVDDRVENPSNNKERKTFLISSKRKSSSPEGEVDPRHSPIRTEIQRLWLLANPNAPAAPWSPRTATALKRFLDHNPAWGTENLLQCVSNRFASDANHAEDPTNWIPKLISYAGGPLNQFNKPKLGGDEKVNGNRAERIEADIVRAVQQAKDAAKASHMDN